MDYVAGNPYISKSELDDVADMLKKTGHELDDNMASTFSLYSGRAMGWKPPPPPLKAL
jgi:hypothetical protein